MTNKNINKFPLKSVEGQFLFSFGEIFLKSVVILKKNSSYEAFIVSVKEVKNKRKLNIIDLIARLR